MKFQKSLIAALVLMASFATQAQDSTESKFGKGLFNVVAKDSSYSANFTVRMQSLFTSEWDIPEQGDWSDAETNMMVRRARLKFKGFAYSPRLTYKIELGLSNRDISGASEFTSEAPRYILDAVAKWNFYENFELWVGQTKLPGNRERVISSGSLETVDRSLLNSRFNIDRETGVQLHHYFDLGNDFLVREAVSISQGEGRNVTSGNLGGHHYVGRVEVLPFGDFDDYSGADFAREETPKLAVGASYSFNNDAVKTRSTAGSYMLNDEGFYNTDISTFFLDAMFKYRGISVMGEYANRTADNPFARNTDGSLTGDAVSIGEGLNLQAGYLFPSNFQVVGRYTSINYDDVVSELIENQYTLALSKYIVKHKLKVQTDLSYNDLNRNFNDGLLYRLQFELQF
ncbi:Phosphate-selective porin O and P [Salinimicrobium catena]|uniref:Phosphate-selective porin O and P n=1 Tax=Salinimicrobium catena TaxID=390640 RepID=A0A1H5NUA2_9FLAO|nr:porin [Salinimicrobium catena]SDL61423.1 Phosphate-selective porin O and P [Salinimicrobium catena]SEF05239.1 Phosphate-selective porin O and P [Salinimicrobium catena]